MKSTKKETVCRVSDRAYRIIISDVIDSMTGCKIDPFTFKQVVTAVRHYLKPEGKPTGLGRKAKVIFDRLLPDLDRAIRRSETARAAAARRKEAAKKTTETEAAETEVAETEVAETEVAETEIQPGLPAGAPKPAAFTASRPLPANTLSSRYKVAHRNLLDAERGKEIKQEKRSADRHIEPFMVRDGYEC